jgi:hypothetical protein
VRFLSGGRIALANVDLAHQIEPRRRLVSMRKLHLAIKRLVAPRLIDLESSWPYFSTSDAARCLRMQCQFIATGLAPCDQGHEPSGYRRGSIPLPFKMH